MTERRTANEWLSPEEIKDFVTPNNVRGFFSVAVTWSVIAGAFTLLAYFPTNPFAWAISLVLLGGRHLGLSILMHECAHQSLFATAWLNDFIGQWFCAAPEWQRLHAYRAHHFKHHARTSLEDDPDLVLTDPFPTSKTSLIRKFARDVTGLAYFRRVAALLLMDAGVLAYTASTGAKYVEPRPSPAQMIRNLIANFGPVLITNSILFGLLAASGNAWLYGVWVLSWATTFSLFVRIRSIAEHAVTEHSTNPLKNTRTTNANVLARLTVAPHHVNFHLEHHLLPKVPHYKLIELHKVLRARGAYADATHAQGYFEVLQQAVTSTRRA
jgi:fatty acid desaturase